MNEPLVSVIIPVKNASRTIGKCLESLMDLDYPSFEVIVVDDYSEDETVQVIRGFGNHVRLIAETAATGPSRARNAAARIAQGQFLAFTDGDCVVDRQWLRQLIKGFETDRVAAVGGAQAVPSDENAFGRKVAFFLQRAGVVTEYVRRPSKKLRFVRHNASCNAVYRKDIFLALGGFLPGLWPGEDVELDHRLIRKGYRILSNPQAVVYHYRPNDMRQFLRMMWRYGWAQGILVRRSGLFRILHVLPFFALAALILWFIPSTLILAVSLSIIAASGLLILSGLRADISWLFMTGFLSWNAGFWQGFIKNNLRG